MTYTVKNFKTKKALKEAIKAGEQVQCYEPGPFGQPPTSGRVCLEGPHFPAPHTWYAGGIIENGVLIKVT